MIVKTHYRAVNLRLVGATVGLSNRVSALLVKPAVAPNPSIEE
jgi:hypothetical protein